MRELKFRVWDRTNKKWIGMDDKIFCCDEDGMVLTWNQIIGFSPDNTMSFTASAVNCQIVQYTGLKDKNGKEIYEGDIVIGGVYYGWEKETGEGIVRFGEWEQDGSGHEYGPSLCCGWFIELLESDFNCDGDKGTSLVNERQKHTTLEVIGNIYEDPELLDK